MTRFLLLSISMADAQAGVDTTAEADPLQLKRGKEPTLWAQRNIFWAKLSELQKQLQGLSL